MATFNPDVDAALAQACQASPADLSLARTVALELLGSAPSVHLWDVRDELRRRLDVGDRPTPVEMDRPDGEFVVPDLQQGGFLFVRTEARPRRRPSRGCGPRA